MPRGRVGPGHPISLQPPEDVVQRVLQVVGSGTAEDLEQLWQATVTLTYDPDDPYSRWWTHRCAARNLGLLLDRPIPVDELPLEEIAGYAALLWPVVQRLLLAETPLAAYLQRRPGEPSHLFWQPETAYVEVCLALYAADRGRWLVALNAAVAEPESPWDTVEKATVSSVVQAAGALQRLFAVALNEVDVPGYAAAEQQPHQCPVCHWWRGWDGVCYWCRGRPVEREDRRWQALEETLAPLPALPPLAPGADDAQAALLGHPAVRIAMIVLKARYGQVPLSQALDIVRGLARLHLAGILRQSGFTLPEAQAVVRQVQQAGVSIPTALRRVLAPRQKG